MKGKPLKSAVSIRKARKDEIDAIHEIIASYASEGILLSRSPDDIGATLDNFFVSLDGGVITGVITHYDYGEHLKEVRSLAVRKSHLRRGIGTLLLHALIRELHSTNRPKIFVLTYAPLFFEKNRFAGIDKDELPEKIWKDCATCKNRLNCTETALVYAGE